MNEERTVETFQMESSILSRVLSAARSVFAGN